MTKKGKASKFKASIQQIFLLSILLFMLPFMSKTTQYICTNCFDICIFYEAEMESESENTELSNLDDDFLYPVSSLLLSMKDQRIEASFTFMIKNRIATDDPSPPPKRA